MKTLMKNIKKELDIYKNIVDRFEEDENVSYVSLHSMRMSIFLDKLMSMDTHEDLEALRERNIFLSELMEESQIDTIHEYLLEELQMPFPTDRYQQKFIDQALRIDENINEINILKLRNRQENKLSQFHLAMTVLLTDNARYQNEDPKDVFLKSMEKYSESYNKDLFVSAIKGITDSGYFKSYEGLKFFILMEAKANLVGFSWHTEEERTLSLLSESKELKFTDEKIKELIDVFVE